VTAGEAAADLPGDLPTDLPRRNGELVFEAPWESRAFGLAAAYVEASGGGWAGFRAHLIAAIDDLPRDTPYYEAWVTALERLVAEAA
jgi:nitrile hydratase accessory protein